MRSNQKCTIWGTDVSLPPVQEVSFCQAAVIHRRVSMFVLLAAAIHIGGMLGGCHGGWSHAGESLGQPASEASSALMEGESSNIQLVSFLRDLSQSPLLPDEVKNRAREALQKLENSTLDRIPMLVLAYLDRSKVPESSAATLHLVVTDEDLDLRGVTIEEHSRDPNGIPLLLEEYYPVYADSLVAPPVGTFLGEEVIPVRIRVNGERRDELAWAQYVIDALDYLIRCHTTPEVLDVSTGVLRLVRQKEPSSREGQSDPSGRMRPESGMPPIWISLPVPDALEVLVRVNDRAGHRSGVVPVYDWTP